MRLGWFGIPSFGIPWFGYVMGCLMVAMGYMLFIIEHTKGYNWTAQPVWRFIILRWFHSLVWLLLATACLIMQWKGEQGTIWAKAISLTGLVIYLLYMLFLVIEKGKSST